MAEMVREAADYARGYEGRFPFMLRMRKMAQDQAWQPTQRQAVAILKCRSNEVGRSMRRR